MTNNTDPCFQNAVQQLEAVTDNAYHEARWLQAYALETHQDFLALVQRRVKGEPLAYLIGSQPFCDIELKVTPDVLIPRQETELLVETVLAKFANEQTVAVADLGTGSGAIILALAHQRPQWQLHAVDSSAAALAIAQENAVNLGCENVQFFEGDWCKALPKGQRYQVIVSNPPYIDTEDSHIEKAVAESEPRQALFSAENGLADLRKIIQQAPAHLCSKGWLLLEHGFMQADAVQSLLLQSGFQSITTLKDQQGLQRVTLGQHLV